MSGSVALVVCVTADPGLRERVIRQLDDCGAVLMCADLDELRATLFPAGAPLGNGGGLGAAPAVEPRPMAELAVSGPPGHDRALNGAPVNGTGQLTATRAAAGQLVVDRAGHTVTWRGEPLPLTRLERELVGRLASTPVTVWTYERLFDTVWGGAYFGDASVLHSAMKRLRRKLRAAGDGLTVETVRGVGYRLTFAG